MILEGPKGKLSVVVYGLICADTIRLPQLLYFVLGCSELLRGHHWLSYTPKLNGAPQALDGFKSISTVSSNHSLQQRQRHEHLRARPGPTADPPALS